MPRPETGVESKALAGGVAGGRKSLQGSSETVKEREVSERKRQLYAHLVCADWILRTEHRP